jgi:nucleotide-binding universal stress UspA family protein
MSDLSPLARFETILLATDGSNFSEGAIRLGIAMARKSGARLTAMTMVKTNPEYEALAPELVYKADRDARAHLDTVIRLAGAEGIECAALVRHGDDPPREITEAARELNVDLVVMGRRGRRGLARLMVGDATVKVIGTGPCSVLVVPQAAEMWRSRVLLGTDGSRFGDAAAVAAGRIAHCCAAPLSVISALVPSHSERRQQEGREAVDRTTRLLAEEGLEVDGAAIPGEADQVIIDAAATRAADLIVLGSHGRTSFGKAMMGSVSERVIGKAKCAVLVVKS